MLRSVSGWAGPFDWVSPMAMQRKGKRNGDRLSYSPLSRLLELEGLILGVRGKLALWLALKEIEDKEPRLAAGNLQELIERAEDQLAHRARQTFCQGLLGLRILARGR